MNFSVGTFASRLTSQATRVMGGSISSNRVTLPLLELGLALPLGITFLYELGEAKRLGHEQTGKNWLYALGEGGLTQAIVQTTRGVYPILGLGWIAYNVGLAKNRLEKLKAGVSTAVSMALGYLGLYVGMGFNNTLRYFDAKRLMGSQDSVLYKLINHLPPNALDAHPDLKQAIDTLHTASQKMTALFEASTPYTDQEIKETIAAFEEAQGKVLAKIGDLSERQLCRLLPEAKGGLEKLAAELEPLQIYQGFRQLNPLFGYLMAIGFIGIPLAKILTGALVPKAPQGAKPPEGFSNFKPVWFNHVPGLKLLEKPFGSELEYQSNITVPNILRESNQWSNPSYRSF